MLIINALFIALEKNLTKVQCVAAALKIINESHEIVIYTVYSYTVCPNIHVYLCLLCRWSKAHIKLEKCICWCLLPK